MVRKTRPTITKAQKTSIKIILNDKGPMDIIMHLRSVIYDIEAPKSPLLGFSVVSLGDPFQNSKPTNEAI
jgi:hypothetical protein